MTITLHESNVRQQVARNTSTSYGLTLVAGLPLPDTIAAGIQIAQSRLEKAAPGAFTWYEPVHLHTTIMSLRRGQYRAAPPLMRSELPENLNSFLTALNACLIGSHNFSLHVHGLNLGQDGTLFFTARSEPTGDHSGSKVPIADGHTLQHCLASLAKQFPGLDTPKYASGSPLTVVIGYAQVAAISAISDTEGHWRREFDAMADIAIGEATVDRVWMVNYANRTLSSVLGKLELKLGQPVEYLPEVFLRQMAIN